jgi:GNAT superfamily N-acetyltransferase
MSLVQSRAAGPADMGLIMAFVRELAAYERLSHAVDANVAAMAEALFGPAPRVFCELAEVAGRAVGFAVWFYNFSTFRGRHGIFLEDLYVRPAARGQGVGKALLAGLAERCLREDLARLEWAVLDWNAPSIDFYRAQGASILEDWRICRMSGAALARLSGSANGANAR